MFDGMRSKETAMVQSSVCKWSGALHRYVRLDTPVRAGVPEVGVGCRTDHVDFHVDFLESVGDPRLVIFTDRQGEAEGGDGGAALALDVPGNVRAHRRDLLITDQPLRIA